MNAKVHIDVQILQSIIYQAEELLKRQESDGDREHEFWLHVDSDVLTRIDDNLSDMLTDMDLETGSLHK